MSDLSDAATRVAIVAALKSKVLEAYELARAEAGEQMDPGDRKAAQLGGGKLGHVTVATGSTRAKVTNDTALTKWVAEHHPDEIVQSVRSSYVNKILDDAKHYGQAVDVTTGELIPGVDVRVGNPYVTVKLADDAAETIAAHWDTALRHVPELPGGDA